MHLTGTALDDGWTMYSEQPPPSPSRVTIIGLRCLPLPPFSSFPPSLCLPPLLLCSTQFLCSFAAEGGKDRHLPQKVTPFLRAAFRNSAAMIDLIGRHISEVQVRKIVGENTLARRRRRRHQPLDEKDACCSSNSSSSSPFFPAGRG